MIFEIINDIEETKHEYTFIDIIVSNEEAVDYDSFKQLFYGEERLVTMAKDLFELVSDTSKVPIALTSDAKKQ